MSQEGQLLDKKSLRAVLGKTANWSELAKDCIAFANSLGGTLLIGIEDGQDNPPLDQTIPPELAECTVNVAVFPAVRTAANGGQFIALDMPRALSVASSTDGRYFLRIADQSKPVTGDDVLRLASERAALPWETLATLNGKASESDPQKLGAVVNALRASDRVKASIKEKTDSELLSHYQLAHDGLLTHLGILCLGPPCVRLVVASIF